MKGNERNDRHCSAVPRFGSIGSRLYNCICFAVGFIGRCEVNRMDDTISRQAAIDEIKEIYEWHDNVTKERIIEHFERLPSAERRGQWIPVTERLPEKEDMYLVTSFNGRPRLDVAWFYVDEEGLGHFSCDLGDFDTVTAWMMPLPTPYKGGEKE